MCDTDSVYGEIETNLGSSTKFEKTLNSLSFSTI